MKILRGMQQINVNTAATIGNFDGVHCGHQALLQALRSKANLMNLPVLVLLFEPQPSEYFNGREAPPRLSSFREKIEFLRKLGVDYVFCLKFDSNLASISAMDFAERIIFSLIKAKYLLIGDDFRFGRARTGDVELLKFLGHRQSCEVQNFSDVIVNSGRVSSTKIRQALQDGNFKIASKLLGRTYSMCGRVIPGDGRGQQWGIPTANLSLHRLTIPLHGVFCVRVIGPRNMTVCGVANIGCRPTVDGSKNILEIHLFDFEASLYGEMLHVYFLHKLRDEVKFVSVGALIEQIHQDITEAKHWFSTTINLPLELGLINNPDSQSKF